MSVGVQIGQRQAPRRTRRAEGGSGLEAALAIVQKDEVPRAVVPHRDVQVAIAVEIGQRNGIRASLFIPQPPREGEGGSPIIEIDPVLLGPVATVGDNHIQCPVAVDVAQTQRGRQFATRAQRPAWPECPFMKFGFLFWRILASHQNTADSHEKEAKHNISRYR